MRQHARLPGVGLPRRAARGDTTKRLDGFANTHEGTRFAFIELMIARDSSLTNKRDRITATEFANEMGVTELDAWMD